MSYAELTRTYETISTEKLVQLQAAFQMDKADAKDPQGRAFCAGRLRLIARVLAKRKANE